MIMSLLGTVIVAIGFLRLSSAIEFGPGINRPITDQFDLSVINKHTGIQSFDLSVHNRHVVCPEAPYLKGYTSIRAINLDQRDMLDRINVELAKPNLQQRTTNNNEDDKYFKFNYLNVDSSNDNNFDSPYLFRLCPRTVFDMNSEEPLEILLDGAVFACGQSGRNDNECTFTGGSIQVSISDSTLYRYSIETTILSGITFEKFSYASILATVNEYKTVVNFTDVIWKDFRTTHIIEQGKGDNSYSYIGININNAQIINGFGETLFSNDASDMTMTHMTVSNVTADNFLLSLDGAISSMNNTYFSESSLLSITKTSTGSAQFLTNVTVTQMNSLEDIFLVSGIGSLLSSELVSIVQNDLFDISNEISAFVATASSRAIIRQSFLSDNTGIQFGYKAISDSTLSLSKITIIGNVAPNRGIKYLLYSFGFAEIVATDLYMENNTGYTSQMAARNGAIASMKNGCFMSGESRSVVVIDKDSSYEINKIFVHPSVASSICSGEAGGGRIVAEQDDPDSACHTPFGTCISDCIPTDMDECGVALPSIQVQQQHVANTSDIILTEMPEEPNTNIPAKPIEFLTEFPEELFTIYPTNLSETLPNEAELTTNSPETSLEVPEALFTSVPTNILEIGSEMPGDLPEIPDEELIHDGPVARTRNCPMEPGLVGYTSIVDINSDQRDILSFIQGEETRRNVNPADATSPSDGNTTKTGSSHFTLCPGTVFDTSIEPLQVLVDGSSFFCGGDGSPGDECIIRGGRVQVVIGDSDFEGSDVQTTSLAGLTFEQFTDASVSVTVQHPIVANFSDIVWRDFNAVHIIEQGKIDISGSNISINIDKADIFDGACGDLFLNDAGEINMTSITVTNVTGDNFLMSTGGAVSFIGNSHFAQSSFLSITTTMDGSTQFIRGVTVTQMVSLQDFFFVSDVGSTLHSESTSIIENDFTELSQAGISGFVATASAVAFITESYVIDNAGIQYGYKVLSNSVLTLSNVAIIGNTAPTRGINYVIFAIGNSAIIANGLYMESNTGYVSQLAARNGAMANVTDSCVMSGESRSVFILAKGSSYDITRVFVHPSFESSICGEGAEGRIAVEQDEPDSICHTPFGTCSSDCIGSDVAECGVVAPDAPVTEITYVLLPENTR